MALSPLVTRVTAPNPGLMTGPGTNSYIVGTDELVVIDPGPDDAAHLDLLAGLGAGRIRAVVVTHTHRDHAPGAAGLAARTGAPVVGFAGRDGFVPTVTAGEGDVVAAAGVTLRALHTPGHASDHLCWLLEEEGTLFSGDHVMQGSTVVVAPPDGDMAAYLASLERLLALGEALAAVAPGHGSLITDPAGAVAGVVEHRRRRERQVALALVHARRATVDELLPDVYAEVGPELLPVARFSLWAHLRKLGAEGVVRAENPDDLAAPWTAL